jgi:hypothetical protein
MLESFADVGGGYSKHDLALLSLHWLVSQIQEHIALDLDLLLRDATDGSAAASWGRLAPYSVSPQALNVTTS